MGPEGLEHLPKTLGNSHVSGTLDAKLTHQALDAWLDACPVTLTAGQRAAIIETLGPRGDLRTYRLVGYK